MAKFELNIYGENDEIIKRYETDHIRFGILLEALEFDEKSEKMSKADQIKGANAIVKRIFYGLTDAELANADIEDVFNTYKQVLQQALKIGGSDEAEKN